MSERELREALVAAGRRLGARGLISAGEGNLSVRVDAERLLVTPTGLRKDELEPEQLLVVPLERPPHGDEPSPDGLRPSSDIRIHRAVLAALPEVDAVAHAHLPASMGLTLAGEAPDPQSLPETALFLPELPLVPFGEMGSAELAARVARTLGRPGPSGRPGAVILERHGAVAVGDGGVGRAAVRQAVDRLELVEVLCRVWRDALLVRAARASLAPPG